MRRKTRGIFSLSARLRQVPGPASFLGWHHSLEMSTFTRTSLGTWRRTYSSYTRPLPRLRVNFGRNGTHWSYTPATNPFHWRAAWQVVDGAHTDQALLDNAPSGNHIHNLRSKPLRLHLLSRTLAGRPHTGVGYPECLLYPPTHQHGFS